jgi:hypothetical protein
LIRSRIGIIGESFKFRNLRWAGHVDRIGKIGVHEQVNLQGRDL